MYRIALLYLTLWLLAPLGLAPLSAEDAAAGKPAAETGTKWKKGDFQPAEACKTCHPRHYEEWRGSMHAYAITDPVFHAMHRLAQKETGGAIGNFCIGCPDLIRYFATPCTSFSDSLLRPGQLCTRPPHDE